MLLIQVMRDWCAALLALGLGRKGAKPALWNGNKDKCDKDEMDPREVELGCQLEDVFSPECEPGIKSRVTCAAEGQGGS